MSQPARLGTRAYASASFAATLSSASTPIDFGSGYGRYCVVMAISLDTSSATALSSVTVGGVALVPIADRSMFPDLGVNGRTRMFTSQGVSIPAGVQPVVLTAGGPDARLMMIVEWGDSASAISSPVYEQANSHNPTITIAGASADDLSAWMFLNSAATALGGQPSVAPLATFAPASGTTLATYLAPASGFYHALAVNKSGVGAVAVGVAVTGSQYTPSSWGWSYRVTGVASDTTAPTLTSPTGTGGTLAATGTVSTNEAGGTLYYLASANATETVPAQGSPMTGWLSQAVVATGEQSVSASGLTAGTRYLHYVQDDAAGNRSARASSASFVVVGSGTTFTLVLSRAANNTGAGKKVSTTFTGVLVYGGDFNDLAGKTLHAIGSTAVNADGDATLVGLPQTGAAMLLRKWADGARSAEFVTVA